MIVTGANYEIFGLLKKEFGFTEARFAKVILKSLSSFNENGAHTFSNFAATFLQEMESEAGTEAASAAEKIIDARGIAGEVRAKDISDYHAGGMEILYFGGAIDREWNTVINLKEGDSVTRTSTAVVQTCLTLPFSDADGGFSLSGIASGLPDSMGMYPESENWKLSFLLRKAQTIEYSALEGGNWSVKYDAEFEPQFKPVTTPGGQMKLATWNFEGLEPGAYYCMHLINQGDSPGVLMDISVTHE